MSDDTKMRTSVPRCPGCGVNVRLESRVYVGSELLCPSCDAVLEVISTEPVELDWANDDEDEEDC